MARVPYFDRSKVQGRAKAAAFVPTGRDQVAAGQFDLQHGAVMRGAEQHSLLLAVHADAVVFHHEAQGRGVVSPQMPGD